MSGKIKERTWVRIQKTVLKPGERAEHLPEDTQNVPFVLWVKGYLNAESEIGDMVSVTTRTGRLETGILLEGEPRYQLDYGDFLQELLTIGEDARKLLDGGDNP